MPLEPCVQPVDGQSDEAVARYDRRVRAEPVRSRRADQCRTDAGAGGDREALAGAVEVNPAQLEAVTDIPDAVEDRPMPLIGYCRPVIVAESRVDLEGNLCQPAQRPRVAIAERGQRIGERPLPPMAHPL